MKYFIFSDVFRSFMLTEGDLHLESAKSPKWVIRRNREFYNVYTKT